MFFDLMSQAPQRHTTLVVMRASLQLYALVSRLVSAQPRQLKETLAAYAAREGGHIHVSLLVFFQRPF